MKTILILTIATVAALQSATALAQDPDTMQRMDKQKHHELMPVHAKLVEKQKAQDAEIDKLMAEVKSASGEKRVDAIVAVLTKLIEQRKEMQEETAARLDR